MLCALHSLYAPGVRVVNAQESLAVSDNFRADSVAGSSGTHCLIVQAAVACLALHGGQVGKCGSLPAVA